MARLPHLYDQFLVSLDTLSDSNYTLNVVITCLNNEYQRQCMYSHPPSEPSTNTPRPQAGNEALSAVAPTSWIAHITCFTCGYKGHSAIRSIALPVLLATPSAIPPSTLHHWSNCRAMLPLLKTTGMLTYPSKLLGVWLPFLFCVIL